MRITHVPIFNEFDIWRRYEPGEPLANLSLYVVEAGSFDLFLAKRYNLCYGKSLKEMMPRPRICLVKHPSVVKRASRHRMVEDVWRQKLSEDAEEDAVLKKTILNTNSGMLEKQINKNQKSKLFDSYEEALFFQEK